MLRLAWRRSASINSSLVSTPHVTAAFWDTTTLHKRNLGHNIRVFQLFPLPPSLACTQLSTHSLRSFPFMSMASGGEGLPPTPPRHTNRLSKERSPYLLQHAHNPVDWYPWGQEAFNKARSEDKPIFLSVGYSTCHWCHVMERESFEDEDIGKILNDNFVCIKVDREERPDVDKVYMTFVQATSGGGGWPMSVWLTPNLRPFLGGTYFPPRDRGSRPGFKTILTRIMEQWQNYRSNLESSGDRILEALKKGTTVAAKAGDSPPLAPDVAYRCFQQLAGSYEEEYGGFRDAPKFPTPVNLMFLMSYWSVNRSTSEGVEALQMAMHTLRMMALGGIHDHVAQGFHRYSTDSSWHVPHFEKMLYDQAQLAVAYITAFQVSGEQFFADVAKDILLYVSRDLSDQSGGFYSAEDADSIPSSGGSEKREGAFCVWTASDIRQLLSDVVEGATGSATVGDIVMHHYGVKELGNVALDQDPHGELQGQNVLIVRYSTELTAARFGISQEMVNELLASARAKMAGVRKIRPRPHLDTKMLASWNGGCTSNMMKHLRLHGVQINACPVFDALRRPSSSASSSGSDSDAQPGTSVIALQSESDNLQPASQTPRCDKRTPFTVAAMGKMSVPQTEECHRKVTAHIVKRLHPFSEVESPTFRDMVKTLSPKYIPPSRDYLANTLIPWYKKNRNRESSGIGIETKNRNRSNSNDTQP
ncbi:spermatogenesis-associated protein 20 isoform X3 [Nerophis ophidion]|uniref:spermatogenesis-associated protein 20 isoform X3 n=1 Tax=Nerophis ophidion TaxID=159077 RepID=UPI002AE08731|nr:spermatogenesis-associated protein 20 isoform X3 [Nerophis ophidion]